MLHGRHAVELQEELLQKENPGAGGEETEGSPIHTDIVRSRDWGTVG